MRALPDLLETASLLRRLEHSRNDERIRPQELPLVNRRAKDAIGRSAHRPGSSSTPAVAIYVLGESTD
jgi:hypothetical protein